MIFRQKKCGKKKHPFSPDVLKEIGKQLRSNLNGLILVGANPLFFYEERGVKYKQEKST